MVFTGGGRGEGTEGGEEERLESGILVITGRNDHILGVLVKNSLVLLVLFVSYRGGKIAFSVS